MHYYCMRKRNTQWFGWIHHTFPLFADAADIDFVIGLVARSLSWATLLYFDWLLFISRSTFHGPWFNLLLPLLQLLNSSSLFFDRLLQFINFIAAFVDAGIDFNVSIRLLLKYSVCFINRHGIIFLDQFFDPFDFFSLYTQSLSAAYIMDIYTTLTLRCISSKAWKASSILVRRVWWAINYIIRLLPDWELNTWFTFFDVLGPLCNLWHEGSDISFLSLLTQLELGIQIL